VLVSGRLQSQSWEKDGQKRTKLEVVAQDVTFLGSRDGGGGGSDNGGANYGSASSSSSTAKSNDNKKSKDVVIEDIGDEPINLDDIPF
jgi:single-strand DNA-binding protein